MVLSSDFYIRRINRHKQKRLSDIHLSVNDLFLLKYLYQKRISEVLEIRRGNREEVKIYNSESKIDCEDAYFFKETMGKLIKIKKNYKE